MLEAAKANLGSPSIWSAAPTISSYPQAGRPITPSLGQKATWRHVCVTSALPPIADIGGQRCSHLTADWPESAKPDLEIAGAERGLCLNNLNIEWFVVLPW